MARTGSCFDPAAGVTTADWLATPTQRLAEVTGGAVFHDGLGGSADGPAYGGHWYPTDVWRHVLASAWTRIAQAEHLPAGVPRSVSDLGSRVVTAGLARDLMRLGLLLHRRWPPYDKWLGTVFGRLDDAEPVVVALADVLGPGDWARPQTGLVKALETVARWTDDTRLAVPVRPGRSRSTAAPSWCCAPSGSPPR